MSSERVDKQWQKKGLAAYSTEAILGTLQHYGVSLDENGFKEAGKDRFPAQLAMDWTPQWKGTGQFAGYPYAAAMELTRRLFPDRLMPMDLSKGLAALLQGLLAKHKGEESPELGQRFESAEEMLEKIPKDEEARRGFLDEALMHLGEKVVRAMDELGETLAKAGLMDEARRFAEFEEKLLPERRGIATALVQAVGGEKDQAVEKLRAAGEEPGRPIETRVMAVESLTHLGALDEALQIGRLALDTAESMEDHHAAMALCEQVGRILDRLGRSDELAQHRERTRRVAAAHHHAHPHHR